MWSHVVLVVGERNSGKTAYIQNALARARRRGLTAAGFYSEAEWLDGVKARFHLRDVAQPGHRRLLASVDPEPGLDLRAGLYYLSSAAFQTAERVLKETGDVDLIVLDEVGPLEMRGGGFRPALRYLLRHHDGLLLLTARPKVATELRRLIEEGSL